MTDLELLHDYATRKSEAAFAELAGRYTGLVYSAALRQSGNPANAEEITQAVFIILARKAGDLRAGTVLSGWLLRTTRYVAMNARRQELHRRNIEQQAMELSSSETEVAWMRIAPILDEALLNLGEQDRSAVALRFFERKSFKEIAAALDTTEGNAQKRVARALEKLRHRFKKRGVVLPAALITGAINIRAVQAAPEEVRVAVNRAVGVGLAATQIATLVELTLAKLATARLLQLALRGATAAAIAVVAGLVVLYLNRDEPVRPAQDHAVAINEPSQTNSPAHVAPVDSAPETSTDKINMRFRVVDAESGSAISKVRLTLVSTVDYPTQTTNNFTTDRQGMALLPMERQAGTKWNQCIEVFRDGFVPKFVSWSERQGDDPKNIPAEYTARLTPAVNIGATVVNETGDPVPGARVVFEVRHYLAPAKQLDRERLTMTSHYHVELTDSQGRWHCHHVPALFGMIQFNVTHPDYAPRLFGSAALGAATNHNVPYLAQADLRNETAVMPLARGATVGGVVVNETGAPIAGAKVTFDHQWAEPTASHITKEDGRFQFNNIPRDSGPASPGTICFLTVQADGYSPKDFRYKGSTPPAESRLVVHPGAELRGRVVDDDGDPVPKATIQVCSHSNVKRFEWSTVTDADGRFIWHSAPAKPEFYVVEAAGYQATSQIKLAADGTEHLIKLRTNPPPVVISGTAVDAATGRPLDRFEVWMSFTEMIYTGYAEPMNSPRPPRLRAVGMDGSFAFTNSDPFVYCKLVVRADGYCPEEQSHRGAITDDAQFEFRLSPAAPLTGIVRLANGVPVVGAVAMLLTDIKRVYMRLPGEFDLTFSAASHAVTDAQGRFNFQPENGAQEILITSPEGFAAITLKELAATPEVTLQPWGSVMGTLKIGNQPGANQNIDLSYSPPIGERTGYSLFLETRTDAEGHFAFFGVPPWSLQLAHRLNFRDGQGGAIPQNLQTKIKVEAGQTNFVNLGGTGRKVIGRVVLKSSEPKQKINWQLDVQTMATKLPGSSPAPKPEAFPSPTEFQAAQEKWMAEQAAFWQSEAGREAQNHQKRYTLVFDQNGSFRIDDVDPGTYELKLRLSDQTKPVHGTFSPLYEPLGTLTKEVTIPEADDPEGPPVDLGVLELDEK